MSYPLFGSESVAVDLGDVRLSCVDPFPTSDNRPMIMEGIENTSRELSSYSSWTRLHIGGEFVSGETEPNCAEILLHSPPPQTRADVFLLTRLTGEQDIEQGCHIYALPELPEGHPKRQWWLRNWTLMQNTITKNGRFGCAIISALRP